MPDDEPDPAQPPAAPGRRAGAAAAGAGGAETCRSRGSSRRGAGTSRWSGWCRRWRSRSAPRCWCAASCSSARGSTIEFASAEGVEAGKTEVRYKEVVIGKVAVGVAARRPQGRRRRRPARPLGGQLRGRGHHASGSCGRASASAASAASARCSRAPTSAPTPASRPRRAAEFKGLEAPPFVLRGEPGTIFVLRSDDLGSLDVGSPVFYRRTPRRPGRRLHPRRRARRAVGAGLHRGAVPAAGDPGHALLERERHRPDASTPAA